MSMTARDHEFLIAGESSKHFNLIVSADNSFDMPKKDVTQVKIPGRNGALLIDNGRYENINVTYTCAIENDMDQNMSDLRGYVGSLSGYQRLEDTFHPDEFRLANLSSGITTKLLGTRYHSGVFDITFDCKPQRFLKTGDEPVYFTPMYSGYWANRSGVASFVPDDSYTCTTIITINDDTECSVKLSGDWADYPYYRAAITGYTTQRDATYFEDYGFAADENGVLDVLAKLRAIVSDVGCNMFTIGFKIYPNVDYTFSLNGVDFPMVSEITLSNPTNFDAKPLITLHNGNVSGALVTVNDTQISISGNATSGTNYIDCELEEVYTYSGGSAVGQGRYVTLTKNGATTYDFPVLKPGDNAITQVMSTAAGAVNLFSYTEIVPRWWTL